MGIGGKDTTGADDRQSSLFKTIVSKTATTSEKRTLVVLEFVNMKTCGRAVSIGPLKYCGNGILLKKINQEVFLSN